MVDKVFNLAIWLVVILAIAIFVNLLFADRYYKTVTVINKDIQQSEASTRRYLIINFDDHPEHIDVTEYEYRITEVGELINVTYLKSKFGVHHINYQGKYEN
jgi:hypothetical protein